MVTQTSDLTTQSNGAAETAIDERSRLLADERRRLALRVLSERKAPLSLSELASAVVERSDEPAKSTGVAVSLHHIHLPKLAASDLIDYDPEENRVAEVRVEPAFFDR